ncbi:MAG: hypothetical protein ACE5NA_03695 [Nitrospiraceae bacterium]
MRTYLREMYPIPSRLLASGLVYTSFVGLLGRIHGVRVPWLSGYTAVGTWSIFSVSLILRLMDELKDRQIDRQLFPKRPLPSGKVRESDIALTLTLLTVLFVVVNVPTGKTFWVSLLVLTYTFLMFRHFFMPGILRANLFLTLATHNPIIPITLGYVVSLFCTAYQLELRNLHWFATTLVISMYWLAFLAWEVARKIRAAEEENAYITYSQLLGRRGAVLLAGTAQTVAFGIGLYFYVLPVFSAVPVAILAAGYGLAIGGHARFLLSPSATTSKLKPFAEWYIRSHLVAAVVDHGLRHGWELGW